MKLFDRLKSRIGFSSPYKLNKVLVVLDHEIDLAIKTNNMNYAKEIFGIIDTIEEAFMDAATSEFDRKKIKAKINYFLKSLVSKTELVTK